ncbi:MAG: hypothetical protein WC353_00400 [Candidatus Peribacter sp.]
MPLPAAVPEPVDGTETTAPVSAAGSGKAEPDAEDAVDAVTPEAELARAPDSVRTDREELAAVAPEAAAPDPVTMTEESEDEADTDGADEDAAMPLPVPPDTLPDDGADDPASVPRMDDALPDSSVAVAASRCLWIFCCSRSSRSFWGADETAVPRSSGAASALAASDEAGGTDSAEAEEAGGDSGALLCSASSEDDADADASEEEPSAAALSSAPSADVPSNRDARRRACGAVIAVTRSARTARMIRRLRGRAGGRLGCVLVMCDKSHYSSRNLPSMEYSRWIRNNILH